MTQAEADERYLPLAGGEMKSYSKYYNIALIPGDGEIRLTAGDGSLGSYVADGHLYLPPDGDGNTVIAGYYADLRGFRFYKVENGDELPIHLYGLLPPEQDDDAVTKGYADQQYLNKLTGGTVEGVLNLKKGITVEDEASGLWFYVDENGIDSALPKIQIFDLETFGANFYILAETNKFLISSGNMQINGDNLLELRTNLGPVQILSNLIQFLNANGELGVEIDPGGRILKILSPNNDNNNVGVYVGDGYEYETQDGDALSGVYFRDGEIEVYGKGGVDVPVRLKGVLDPVGDSDAANKKYVDAAIAAAIEKLKNP